MCKRQYTVSVTNYNTCCRPKILAILPLEVQIERQAELEEERVKSCILINTLLESNPVIQKVYPIFIHTLHSHIV